MPDMTNARAAVYALQEPLVQQCPELTIDRVIASYCVGHATAREDRCDCFLPMGGYTIAQTVAMKIDGAHMPENVGTRQGANSIYACY